MGSLIKETPFSEITATLEILDRRGVGREDLKKFRAAAPEVQRHIAEILMNADTCSAGISNKEQTRFAIAVDYAQALAVMINEGGYDWVNPDITDKRFPLKGAGIAERSVWLLCYERVTNTDQVFQSMHSNGYTPALLEDLLAFGAKYSQEQLEYPIAALGSTSGARGNVGVPYLDTDDNGRVLRLRYKSFWRARTRFLARSKAFTA